jgi:hypothetical protein
MDDEHEAHEIDDRLRAALTTDEAAMDRIVHRAMAAPAARRARGSTRAMLAAAAAAGAAIAGVWLARNATPPPRAFPSPTELAVTVKGSLLVVDSTDGRRWIVGPPSRRTAGRYIIVVAQ